MSERKLEGKVVIVTGSASGLGRAISIMFAKEGAKIVGADIWEKGGLETQKTINEKGGDSIFVNTDVTKAKSVEDLVHAAVKEYGRIDILINSAGVHTTGKVADMEETAWDKVLDTDLKGLFLCSKYAVKELIKSGGGSIVNVSSMAAISGFYGEAAYCVAKAGAVALTKVTALECARNNIRVNCILPGNTETLLNTGFFAESANVKRALERTPMGRFGKADEIARACLFLVSDDASYITGSSLVIDGGTTSSLPTGRLGWLEETTNP
jgi:NAD(P)-dependent dehydrogenase (short-subunit alcohol dehydrogenase family)